MGWIFSKRLNQKCITISSTFLRSFLIFITFLATVSVTKMLCHFHFSFSLLLVVYLRFFPIIAFFRFIVAVFPHFCFKLVFVLDLWFFGAIILISFRRGSENLYVWNRFIIHYSVTFSFFEFQTLICCFIIRIVDDFLFSIFYFLLIIFLLLIQYIFEFLQTELILFCLFLKGAS